MDFAASASKAYEKFTRELIAARLHELWERTGDPLIHQISRGRRPLVDGPFANDLEFFDWVSTGVMSCFKNTADAKVFEFLFELNHESFLHSIQAKVHRQGSHVDPQDVLQEVFLNIFRYPHRFIAEKSDSFRNWGHRIVRNTLLKFLKGQNRITRCLSLDDDATLEQEDVHGRTPDRTAIESESAGIVDQAYLLYLNLYLLHFGQLSPKEQRALTMVEVEGASYKFAADALGIRLENLKMVIFRGRRKIFRGLTRSLADLGTDPLSVTSAFELSVDRAANPVLSNLPPPIPIEPATRTRLPTSQILASR